MHYTRKEQNAVTFASFLMICYGIAMLIWLRQNSWEITGVLLFCINLVNVILSFFGELNKLITSLVCLFVAVVTVFLFSGYIFWFGCVLGIYSIFLTIHLLIGRE